MAQILGMINNNSGSQKKVTFSVQMSSSYTSGGEIIPYEAVGMSSVLSLLVTNGPLYLGQYIVIPTYDFINDDINFKVFEPGGGGPSTHTIDENLPAPDELRLYVSLPSAFNNGETLTGLTSGATCTLGSQQVDAYGRPYFVVTVPAVANFQIGETVQGAISAGTAQVESNVVMFWDDKTVARFDIVTGVASNDPPVSASYDIGYKQRAFVTGLDVGQFAFDATNQELLVSMIDIATNPTPDVFVDYTSSSGGGVFVEVAAATDLSGVILICDIYGV